MKQEFYCFGEPTDTEPPGMECIANYGETVEEAVAANAKDKVDDEKDGGTDLSYWDSLKLFRVTYEEIPWTPAGGNAE